MKALKKVVVASLVATLALSTSVAYAASENEYLIMGQGGDDRINNAGNFTFSIHTQIEGNLFEVSGNTATLSCNASVLDQHYEPYLDNDISYTVKVKTDTLGITKCTLSTVTSKKSSTSTNQLKSGEKYRLHISTSETGDVGSSGTDPWYVEGSGHLTTVTKVYK